MHLGVQHAAGEVGPELPLGVQHAAGEVGPEFVVADGRGALLVWYLRQPGVAEDAGQTERQSVPVGEGRTPAEAAAARERRPLRPVHQVEVAHLVSGSQPGTARSEGSEMRSKNRSEAFPVIDQCNEITTLHNSYIPSIDMTIFSEQAAKFNLTFSVP